METFRQAIIEDLMQTLNDKKNGLLVISKKPACHCRNNIDYGLSQLRKSVDNTLETFKALEMFMLKKQCAHVWHRKRMDDASWDALPQASS